MADLVLDAQIDLEVNEADLQRSVDRAGDIIQDRGERATRPSRGGRQPAGIGGIAIGNIIGNIVSGLIRSVGKVIKQLINLPRRLIEFARTLRDASPLMNRVFTIFERRMMMIRRTLGNALAPRINEILDRVAAFIEDNEQKITKALGNLIDAVIAVSAALLSASIGILRFIENNPRLFGIGQSLQERADRVAREVTSARKRNPKGFGTEEDLDRILRGDVESSPMFRLVQSLREILERIEGSAEEQKEMTARDRLRAANDRLTDIAAQANRFALDPITKFLGAAPDPDARRRNLRDRGIN